MFFSFLAHLPREDQNKVIEKLESNAQTTRRETAYLKC